MVQQIEWYSLLHHPAKNCIWLLLRVQPSEVSLWRGWAQGVAVVLVLDPVCSTLVVARSTRALKHA